MINKYIAGYLICQRTKIYPQEPIGELRPLDVPTGPWQVIGVDFITDLPPCFGYDAIMMIIDHFTKYLYALPCTKEIDSKGTAKLFRDYVWPHTGLPNKIVSDRRPQF